MPVRKIPKNYICVTGIFSSAKNGKSLRHEELLERDLMILLEFDDTVESFEEQPVNVPLVVNGRKCKPYVPDILIHYFPTISGEARRTVLGEVKHTEDLKKNKAKYAPKFEAATLYAEERGWEFRIFTEKEIRTPYLANLKFLREYHDVEPDAALLQEVIRHLQNKRSSVTVELLLQKLCPTDADTLQMAPATILASSPEINPPSKLAIASPFNTSLSYKPSIKFFCATISRQNAKANGLGILTNRKGGIPADSASNHD